jgi:formylglycine-generating enzyme required for sulfatase activity
VGQDDYPVSGVSWYEAAAYAEFVGKSLPTIYQWFQAASLGIDSSILETSNFSGKGPAPVGSYGGLGPFGTYDMAGNVKEWCFNSQGSRRYILGGASTEPKYMYQETDARPPLDRSATNGFRLANTSSQDRPRNHRPRELRFSVSTTATPSRFPMPYSASIKDSIPTIERRWTPK